MCNHVTCRAGDLMRINFGFLLCCACCCCFFSSFFSLPFVLLITERYILLRPHKKRQKLMMDLKHEAFLVARE